MSKPGDDYSAKDWIEDSRTLADATAEKFAQYQVLTGKSNAATWRHVFNKPDDHKGASAAATQYLKARPEVGYRIGQLQKQKAARVIETVAISEAYVLDALKETAERCLQRKEVLSKDGVPSGEWQFNPAGANKALELMGRSIGMFSKEDKRSDAAHKNTNELKEELKRLKRERRGREKAATEGREPAPVPEVH